MGFITEDLLDAEAVQRAVTQTARASGALATFSGIVRPDRQAATGRMVIALHYDAYLQMAECQLGRLLEEAKTRWVLEEASLRHRLGRVPVGEASLVVAVAAPHRGEAFAACQFLIEQIKCRVPIWKREEYDDGTSRWSGTDAHV